MKTSTLIAAIAAIAFTSAVTFAAAGSAFAQEATFELPQPVTSSVSRAQVQADLAQARADGSLRVTEADFPRSTPTGSVLSREAVKAETLAAIASGEVHLLNSEQNSFDGAATRSHPQAFVRTAQIAR